MDRQKEVLDLAVRIGEVLLKNGGEIFRVQQTMQLIAKAYEVEGLHVYVLANGIFASVEDGEGGGNPYVRQVGEVSETQKKDTEDCLADCPEGGSQVRYIPLSSTHLGRVAAVNDLSRQIVAHKCTLEEAWDKVEKIDRLPCVSNKLQVLVSGIGAGSICYILGGSLWDSVASCISGLLLWCFVIFLSNRGTNKIVVNILSSALVTLNGVLLYTCLFGDNMDKIIIGSIVPLLPGGPFTNSIRDFLNGDYLSGTIRMIDSVMVACCIALGVGIVLRIVQLATGMNI